MSRPKTKRPRRGENIPAPNGKSVRVPILRYHTAQQWVVDSIADGRKQGVYIFTVMAGRRTGKTALARDLALRAMLDGKKAGYWVPTYPDGKGTWAWFMWALGGPDSPLVSVMNKSERRIELVNGGELDMWALDKDGAGRGFDYDVAVVEEAAKAKNLKSAMDETIEATVSDRAGYILVISTPRGRNYFHDLYLKGQTENRDMWSFRIPSYANPHVSHRRLRSIKRRLKEDGRWWVWVQEYLAKPADQGVNPFNLGIVERQLQDAPTGRPVVAWGLDLAKRSDFTVMIGLDSDRRVSCLYRWNHTPWPETEGMIADHHAEAPDAPILMDSTGIGDPIHDHLEEMGLPVIPFQFNVRSRSNLLDQYIMDFAAGYAYALKGQHFLEISKAEYLEKSGRLKVIVPEPANDDCMMAGALASKLAHDLGYPQTVIATSTSQRYSPNRPRGGRLANLRKYA